MLNVKFYNGLTLFNINMLRSMGSERVKLNVKFNSKFIFIKAVMVSTSRYLPIGFLDCVNFPKERERELERFRLKSWHYIHECVCVLKQVIFVFSLSDGQVWKDCKYFLSYLEGIVSISFDDKATYVKYSKRHLYTVLFKIIYDIWF